MHTNPEVLALLALGEHQVDAADSEHIATCEQCRAELASLTGLIEQGRHAPDRETLDEPSEAVWAAIQSELGFIPLTRSWPTVPDPSTSSTGAAAASSATSASPPSADDPTTPGAPGPTRPGTPGTRSGADDRRRTNQAAGPASDPSTTLGQPGLDGPSGGRSDRGPRRRLLAIVLAAALALIAGIGIGVGADRLRQPTETVIGRATLQALPAWPGANGTAIVEVDRTGNRTLVVDLHTPQPAEGSQQVWLIDATITAMQPMGFLNADGRGSWPIPPGTDLSKFPIVDVSDEPAGDTTVAHSGDSIVRGELQQ
jgi:hypothetical protein